MALRLHPILLTPSPLFSLLDPSRNLVPAAVGVDQADGHISRAVARSLVITPTLLWTAKKAMPPALDCNRSEPAVARPTSESLPSYDLPLDPFHATNYTRRNMTAAQIRFLGMAEELFTQIAGEELVMSPIAFHSYYLYVMHRFEYQGRKLQPTFWLLHCTGTFVELFDRRGYESVTWVMASHLLSVFIINSPHYLPVLE